MKYKFILIFFFFMPLLGFCQLGNGGGSVKKVAILEVVDKDENISSGIKLMLRSSLTKAITNMPGYEAYTRVDVDQIMKEQNFQRTGMVSDAQIKKLGEMSGASYILVAEAAYMDQSRNYLIVTATILNVESGKIDNTSYENTSVSDLDIACNKLAASLFNYSSSGITSMPTGGSRGTSTSNLTIQVRGVSFEMIYVKGGTFSMGATSEQGSDAESDEYVHQVTLSDYYIGKFEVTQALWQAVMGSNPSYFKNGDEYPVEYVSYYDVQEFLSELNRMTGKNFYLPTEAQWEFAARGGTKSQHYKYSGGNVMDYVGWYSGNSGSKTHPVGMKRPNELGIYDMSGNVWEWCLDWYGSYGSSSQRDPAGASSGSYRVLRGGGWYNDAYYCRVSNRGINSPGHSSNGYGFRLVLVP